MTLNVSNLLRLNQPLVHTGDCLYSDIIPAHHINPKNMYEKDMEENILLFLIIECELGLTYEILLDWSTLCN